VTRARQALIVAGGWDGHRPYELAELFASLLRPAGFSVDVQRSLGVLAEGERMAAVDLVVPIWTMGELGEAEEQGLATAVAAGTGLAGCHGGMADAFRASPLYQWMVGGQWVAHPDGVVEYEVEIVAPDDPITAGIESFRVVSEQYYMHVDPSNEVLATTTFRTQSAPWVDGCVMPVVWKRRFGEGRVFYSSIGHSPSDFDIPEALEIQRRGLLWAAGH